MGLVLYDSGLNDSRAYELSCAFEGGFLRYSREIGDYLKSGFGVADATEKSGPNDLVTKYDAEAENIATSNLLDLRNIDGAIGFITEEGTDRGPYDTYVVIDGIDGTSKFVKGEYGCTSQAALIHEGNVLAAGIYDIVKDDVYTASIDLPRAGFTKQFTAYRNEIRSIKSNLQSLDAVGKKVALYTHDDKLIESLTNKFTEHGIEVEMSMAAGQIAIALANSELIGFINMSNDWHNEWDFAPPTGLLRAAGFVIEKPNAPGSSVLTSDREFIFEHPKSSLIRDIVRETS